MPGWARPLTLAALVVVVAALTWRGVQERGQPSRRSRAYEPVAGVPAPRSNPSGSSTADAAGNPAANGPANVSATWQREMTASFDAAAREATAGNLTAAQMAVDRGAAIVISARVQKQPAAPDYFESSIAQLDRVVRAHPGNERLDEHVNLARIEVAQLRSALETPPPNATLASATSDANPAANFAASNAAKSSAAPGAGAGDGAKAGALKDAVTNPGVDANAAANRVSIGAPQSVEAGALVDPSSMGGSFVDATLMPHTSELLEPPSSRTFADKVRVENLTFAGATQTLDGLRFKNVTFIGTRLRFEGGQVELQNVHFVHCTFGFTTDARGARLANAVALGHTSLLVE